MRNVSFFFSLLLIFLFSCSKDGGLAGTTSDSLTNYADKSGIGGSSGGGSGNGGGGTPGVITAGEWNDLQHWDFWNALLQKDTFKTYPGLWGFYPSNRLTITVKDANNQALPDVQLSLNTGSQNVYGVTNNLGNAELFPALYQPGSGSASFILKAVYNNQVFDLGPISAGVPITKNLPVTKTRHNTLDIQFVVDATGSMGDEITFLKTELKDVLQRAGSRLPGMQLNMGAVFYRDEGDEYLTRTHPFTTDVNALTEFINDQRADGGGDFPEAVDAALAAAVQQQWSTNATNRLLFLILDAPPHNTPLVMDKLKAAVTDAQKKGIRIIPVSASGIDKETEFLMRFLSIGTNGTYVFITNDSGIGNPHLTPTVGDYDVEYLNDLMVRLITAYGQPG